MASGIVADVFDSKGGLVIQGIAAADARLIVTAVNCFDELRVAAKLALDCLDPKDEEWQMRQAHKLLTEALAKARKEGGG